MLVGGLGGIGREIALWMAERGAQHIILVNGSGPLMNHHDILLKSWKIGVCNVYLRAFDIADRGQMAKVTADLAAAAPPIAGVIQGAMVPRDTLIENVTLEDYHAVLRPKLLGTWNLHRHLPKELDWFIMLSSVSGIIGNATQASYAAGSTFMDSFAADRNRYGLHAVSICLGPVKGAGWLVENPKLAAKMTEQGFQCTDMKTVISLIELAMTTSPQSDPSHSSHIIAGLGNWRQGRSLPNFDAPLFSALHGDIQTTTGDGEESSASQLHHDIKEAKTLDEASGIVYAALTAKVAYHIAVPVDSLSQNTAITEYGIDSHGAIEQRNWILRTTESPVSVLEILSTTSMMCLATAIVLKSPLVKVDE